MSQLLINLNPDLKRLRDEGYAVSVRGGHLVVDRVPYLRGPGQIGYGTLVSKLTLRGDQTERPSTHVAHFAGDYPCDREGRPLEQIRHQSGKCDLGNGLTVDHSFSSKPPDGYTDYYHKMSTYAAILAGPARVIDPSATERPYPVIENVDGNGVFCYPDTASSRAGINDINERVSDERVGIIGLGGTGSYVLDLVAKTPVQEIHLFDDDGFLTHNAFRCPGAASLTQLRAEPSKVAYLAEQYGVLHRGIVPHESRVGPSNLQSLDRLTFVFLCLDDGAAKRPIIQRLEDHEVPFIDAGLGVYRTDDAKLGGVLRVTTSTPDLREHVHKKGRIPLVHTGDNDYTSNIQIAELNALNASLAVIRWKKYRGIYLDLEHEHHTAYTIDGNAITNEDKCEQHTHVEA
ncbi:MAG: ThiF family adenylyltransferase [Solirubrobacterales bacterium]